MFVCRIYQIGYVIRWGKGHYVYRWLQLKEDGHSWVDRRTLATLFTRGQVLTLLGKMYPLVGPVRYPARIVVAKGDSLTRESEYYTLSSRPERSKRP